VDNFMNNCCYKPEFGASFQVSNAGEAETGWRQVQKNVIMVQSSSSLSLFGTIMLLLNRHTSKITFIKSYY
jgi:hypothetical protein